MWLSWSGQTTFWIDPLKSIKNTLSIHTVISLHWPSAQKWSCHEVDVQEKAKLRLKSWFVSAPFGEQNWRTKFFNQSTKNQTVFDMWCSRDSGEAVIIKALGISPIVYSVSMFQAPKSEL